jgi:hypothetical protein
MRRLAGLFCFVAIGFQIGCGERVAKFEGPTVDAFTGRLVHNGKPLKFPDGENVSMKLFHEKGQSFGVPLQNDASFKIGWMPIGKYSATLMRTVARGAGKKAVVESQYSIPGGLEIQNGKTDYSIDLGKGWKP